MDSFWWKVVLKLLNKFKGIVMVNLKNGSIVLMWHDMWNNRVRDLQLAKLFSYTYRNNIAVQHATKLENLHDIFQLPMSEAFKQ
jgi:hypothetical protein